MSERRCAAMQRVGGSSRPQSTHRSAQKRKVKRPSKLYDRRRSTLATGLHWESGTGLQGPRTGRRSRVMNTVACVIGTMKHDFFGPACSGPLKP